MEPPPAYDHTKQPAYPVPPHQSYQQQGYAPQPQPQPMQQPPMDQFTVPAQTTSQIVTVGDCPVCHIGNVRRRCGCSPLAILLAILLLPLGLFFCFWSTEKVCSHCGARFGA
ncbi:brain protein I3-like [Patiria miniata]|uniref:Membrane protein BRI3 n=1 Tax=Patiria miniata TaxID=46514 RepID=A0A914ANL9_PATMI|nr:brain protein I3-like [Patiria miniata]